MKRIFILSIFLSGAIFSLPAQNTWHKKIPSLSHSTGFCHFSTNDNQYFLSSNKEFFQWDALGSVTGFYQKDLSGPTSLWTSVLKKHTAGGHPCFWIVRRTSPSSASDYMASVFIPGTGFTGEQTFTDNIGAMTHARPVLVNLDDSTFVAFGVEFVRKIRYSWGVGFLEEWAKPLNFAATVAIKHNGGLIVAGENGVVARFDENANLLWTQNHAVEFRSLKTTAGGFIACGKATDTSGGVVIRLDDNGAEIWKKVTGDKEYWDVVATADGGFAVAGESDSSKMMLALTTSDGTQLWKKEYGKGIAFGLSQAADEGFVVAGRSAAPKALHLIKTDAAGITSPAENALLRDRRVETAGVQATFEPSPSLFFNESEATLITPSNAATVLSFAPWIGGLDDNDDLHIAAAEYGFYTGSDYQTGLINGKKGDLDRVWKVSREEIARLRLDFGIDQKMDDLVPFDLLTWPARGNPHLLYNLDFTPVETDPALFPAPFTDANGDGTYNVYDGDYPRIKGDQMAWWMLTDSTEHEISNGAMVGADLFVSAYVFNCPQNNSIDNSLFVDFEVINRSPTDYHDTYMGFFTDFDLGCFEDDFIGSIPDANSFYVYNEDNLDSNCGSGIQGFGEEIPVQTVTLLDRTLDHSIFFNNAAVGTPLPGTTAPMLPYEFYNFIRGKWRDGLPLTSGGTGYNPGSTDYTDYIFPGNPNDPKDWSLCTVNLPYGDRRMVNSHGPFTFASGDTFNVQLAFTIHPDIPHPCPDIFALVKPTVTQISQWNNDGALVSSTELPEIIYLSPGQNVTLDANVPNAAYIWSNGATTPAINVAQPGEYSVTVTPATGCQIVENVLVQSGTFAGQPVFTPSWKIQPNPAKDFVFVECADCFDGDMKVVVRNAQGAVLADIKGPSPRLRLETSTYPAGLYWLELWQKGQFRGRKKLVLLGK